MDSGSADELVAPPSPTCDDLVFLTEVTFSDAGVPLDIPRFGVGPGLVTSFVVPDFPVVGPGIVVLNEVITFDGHTGRDIWPAQLNERVQFEFLLDGVPQALTPFTPDVPDGALSAWLDVDMGSYELPNGADELRIVHYNDPGNTDSVVVSALCGRHEPFPEEPETTTIPATTVPVTVSPTTEVATTVTPTTAAPTTTTAPETTTTAPAEATTTAPAEATTTAAPETSTTAAPATSTTAAPVSTTTEVTTEVRGTVEENTNQLAATGAEDLAIALIAAGLIFLGSALVLQSKDPEEMFSV